MLTVSWMCKNIVRTILPRSSIIEYRTTYQNTIITLGYMYSMKKFLVDRSFTARRPMTVSNQGFIYLRGGRGGCILEFWTLKGKFECLFKSTYFFPLKPQLSILIVVFGLYRLFTAFSGLVNLFTVSLRYQDFFLLQNS